MPVENYKKLVWLIIIWLILVQRIISAVRQQEICKCQMAYHSIPFKCKFIHFANELTGIN